MNLQEMLHFRRAVRRYTSETIDSEKVKECLKLATLTPTSSNMQLYEMYHITEKSTLEKLAHACLSQGSATTAQQMVVFVSRNDKHRERAQTILKNETENIRRNSPPERHAHRIKLVERYYGKLMPFTHTNFFGIFGLFRKILTFGIGLFRPIFREVWESDNLSKLHQSTAMVAQTFMIAMSEIGYDTCPLGGFDSKLVKKALNLSSSAEITMVISCGKRDPKGVWGERFRVPFEEVYRKG